MDFPGFIKCVIVSTSSETVRFLTRVVFAGVSSSECVVPNVRVINCWWIEKEPVPVAAQSEVWVCGLSPAQIVGSNPTGGMDVCLLWMLCVVREKELRRADYSSRGVLPNVERPCVWSRSLRKEEAVARVGSQELRGNTDWQFESKPSEYEERIATHSTATFDSKKM